MKFAALALFLTTATAQDENANENASACFDKALLDYTVYTDKDCATAKEGGMMDDAKKTTWLTAANAAYSAVTEDKCTGTDTAGAGYAKKVCQDGKSLTITFYSDKDCKTELTADTDPKVTADQTKAFNKWGDKSCIATADAAVWIQITTASFIKATAVAAVAVAASLYWDPSIQRL